MAKKGFGNYIKQAIEILKLNTKAMTEASKDEKAFGMAILFIAIGGVAGAIGMLNPIGIVLNPIIAIIGSFIGVGILHILAKLFGGKGTFTELYKVMGLAYLIQWISVIPLIGPILSGILGLWVIVVNVVALKTVYKLSTGKAIVVILIPLIIIVIIALVVGAEVIAALVGAGAVQ